MRKYLFIILLFILFPCLTNAEEKTKKTYRVYFTSETFALPYITLGLKKNMKKEKDLKIISLKTNRIRQSVTVTIKGRKKEIRKDIYDFFKDLNIEIKNFSIKTVRN